MGMSIAKTAKIWFVNPQTKKIFWDWIDIDPSCSYYHTMVFECGPTQIVAEMYEDGTVQSVRYEPYGINTTGLRWFEEEDKARAFLEGLE